MKRIFWVALCFSAMFTSATACCAATGPFNDQPASARSLPADNLPPFGVLDEHGHLVPTPPMPAGALHRGAGRQDQRCALAGLDRIRNQLK